RESVEGQQHERQPGAIAARRTEARSGGIDLEAEIRIVEATAADVPVILELIRGLAEYEKLSDQVTATEDKLQATLFGAHPAAEVLLGYVEEECAGFALFFQTYSTFLAKPGIYLEDLFVKSEFRGRGI